ncbi:chorion peroxidase-like [Pecten maximus]|uniref:chorion peroxidase-like n=1 Tax=Pecten maximus TaxID=6579 RepID=UPI001458DADF|nr:chorion peroxidase-like [Pecten maximus]
MFLSLVIRMLQIFMAVLLMASAGQGALSSLNTNALLTGMIEVPSEARVASQFQPVQAKSSPSLPDIFRSVESVIPSARKSFPSAKSISPSVQDIAPSLSVIQSSVNDAISKIRTENLAEAKLGAFDTVDSATEGFGPHLGTSSKAIALAEFADLVVETAKDTATRLNVQTAPGIRRALSKVGTNFLVPAKRRCPFSNPRCDSSSQYRTIDGSCNNLNNPLWGRAFTAFERFLPPAYDDGVNSPRTKGVFRKPLPSARNVSLEVHTNLGVRAKKLSHLAMEFGQFVSHDIQMNALAKGYGGRNLNCCRFKKRKNCFHIPVASNDEFFDKTCLNFVRALPAPSLDCRLGVRQQLNQVTHFLDGSAIYGSDQENLNLLRDGAFLKSQGNNDLLPLNSNAICAQASRNKCFRAGDVRVNQQPALISLQTVWMRHHNNLARQIKGANSGMSDEIIFQETKKLVTAQLQHITYNEWLQEILGDTIMNQFDLKPRPSGQYYTDYNTAVKPMIRNAFSAAAFRFGHSMIGDDITEKKASGTVLHHRLHTTFLKPELAYSGGVNSIMTGLYNSPSHKTDQHLTHEVTRHLFQTAPKNGLDLAALNIQRGRDHGIFDYNTWRVACNLGLAQNFDGLDFHSDDMKNLLKKVYDTVFDIDLFTGGVSESITPGGNIGTTFACLIGIQFQALKKGDRFFYESDTNVKFPIGVLDEIRKTTMAKIICDTTGVTSIPRNVFRKQSSTSNPDVNCGSLPSPSFCSPVNGRWSSWSAWSFTPGCISVKTRTRQCNNPAPNACGQDCSGSKRDVQLGGGTGGGIFDLTGNNCNQRSRLPIRPVPLPNPGLPFPRLPFPRIPEIPRLPEIPRFRNIQNIAIP